MKPVDVKGRATSYSPIRRGGSLDDEIRPSFWTSLPSRCNSVGEILDLSPILSGGAAVFLGVGLGKD
eukprot:CAMPEP_0197462152 /NCGR_PEP_ID=MMETSP1175-20131217/58338_1 /TAXON_ID=1003142 /ORGANISM="Triceratium dubium, Strain CCMP147" /LENGTH=66 /DNA_ID=CAMNT_0042997585 /DNA_START=434 /DNA_END=634 /DNA_ORIENTATION=-